METLPLSGNPALFFPTCDRALILFSHSPVPSGSQGNVNPVFAVEAPTSDGGSWNFKGNVENLLD